MEQSQESKNSYEPKEAEKKWQKYWEENKIYGFDANDDTRELFVIDTPPPTVSGKMHLGHAFSYSQQDFIARYQRMKGKNVFYPFGTDDNGLATERLIEKIKNVKAVKMKRSDFINLCLETLNEIRPDFVQDWKNIGMSCDFSLFYSTINGHCRKISQKSFVELYKKGREYRKESPTIWCPECQTAIAQVELEDKELDSTFNDIIFKIVDENFNEVEDLIIATTRPELLSSCVAVFVHPDDKRYKKYVGKKAKVPIFEHVVQILSDERVNMEKGTGCVMCCTFGDQTDIEWFKAYNLPLRISITKDGKMTELSGKYQGLNITEARKEIIKDLKEKALLVNQKQIKHNVNVHERCGTPIEILNTKQWFIKYLDLKDEFKKDGLKLKWYPDFMKSRLINWIDGLQWDWCISRQRFFGVPFPVWYCKKCDYEVVADESMLPVDPIETDCPIKECPKCNSNEFVPEKDVLDTWATSSLTPILAIELVKGTKNYEKLFPMDLRPQAHDIITFWLFNTLVKSQLHYNKNPWKNVMISGWALDPHGKKMSKSKGNVIAPQEMIEKYSADALRFWAAGSKLGDDLPFQEKDLITGKKMITKLWNASKFVIMHLKDFDIKKIKIVYDNLNEIDKWLLSKLQKVIKNCTESFENYEYSKAKQEIEIFFWNVFCDNYLELVKDRLYNSNKYEEYELESAKFTLYESLLTILKLIAPIMPFITEEIYHQYFSNRQNNSKEKLSIHLTKWPEFNENFINQESELIGDLVVLILSEVRKYKSSKRMSLKDEISLIIDCKEDLRKKLELVLEDIQAVCYAKNIDFGKGDIIISENLRVSID
ncbi:MAG: valine--tRNA ligase [Candidatus Woesearchaeota archaeon]